MRTSAFICCGFHRKERGWAGLSNLGRLWDQGGTRPGGDEVRG